MHDAPTVASPLLLMTGADAPAPPGAAGTAAAPDRRSEADPAWEGAIERPAGAPPLLRTWRLEPIARDPRSGGLAAEKEAKQRER